MTFTVCFVYNEETDYTVLREFCEQRRIKYKARYFNSSKYSNDRDCIVRLPAIHILEDNALEDTVYPGFEAMQKIEKYYYDYLTRRKKRVRIWKRIGRWFFGRQSLKTDSPPLRPRVSSQ